MSTEDSSSNNNNKNNSEGPSLDNFNNNATKDVEIDPDLLHKFVTSDTKIDCFPVVEGLQRTAPSTVMKELQIVAKSRTVKELIRNAEYAKNRWQRLNIFKSVDFNLEPVRDGKPEDVVIRFFFSEKKALKEIGVFASAETNNMPEVKGTFHNLFGRAYTLSCHVTPSMLRNESYSVGLTSHLSYLGEKTEYILSKSSEPHPLHFGDQERITQAKIVVHFDNSSQFAMPGGFLSHQQEQEQEDLALKLEKAIVDGDEKLASELTKQKKKKEKEINNENNNNNISLASLGRWQSNVTFGFQERSLIPKDSTPEFSSIGSSPSSSSTSAPIWRGVPSWLQHHFTPSTKAFLRYQINFNNVQYLAPPWYNAFSLPVSGTDFTASAELAGGLLGGDTSLAKTEVQCIHHKTILPFVVLDLAFRSGFAAGFGGSEWLGQDARWSDLRLSDRFYLNWRNVRGYLAVGPNTNTEAQYRGEAPPRRFRCLGGNFVWAASASLNFPFPLWPSNGIVSSHIFANVGNLALVDNFSHFCDSFKDIFTKPLASVGAGLVVMQIPSLGPVPNGRLELNLSLPVSLSGVGNGEAAMTNASSPWIFDKVRWGLHWTSL